MFLAIDRVSKFTYVEFHEHAGKIQGAAFLENVIAAFPYKIHKVLTDNGMAFADLPKNREGPTRRYLGAHIFDRVCLANQIEHRLTKPYHPWTNGHAERMNRTVKDATVKAFHYDNLEGLKAHVLAFVTTYNFAKHLKALRWRTPFQAICDAWTKDPSIFKINPHHLIPGPHTQAQYNHYFLSTIAPRAADQATGSSKNFRTSARWLSGKYGLSRHASSTSHHVHKWCKLMPMPESVSRLPGNTP